MLGTLARWLRILGEDTLYFRSIEAEELIRLAVREDRWVLTRDTRLARRLAALRVRFLLLASNDLGGQLRETARVFGLEGRPRLIRCIVCNAVLESASRAEAREAVPPFVYRTQSEFARCPACRRFYWAGTHPARIEQRLADLLRPPAA